MKNDRRTYKTQYSSSGGLPLARVDTVSENIAQLTCHCDPDAVGRSNLTDCRGISPPSLLDGSSTPDQQWKWSPPLGRPPTGFSELDVGRPPDAKCDIGLLMECCQELSPDSRKLNIRVRTKVLTPRECEKREIS